jgi:hypothetical protein
MHICNRTPSPFVESFFLLLSPRHVEARFAIVAGHEPPLAMVNAGYSCSFGWWLMAGADLFWEKSIAGWLLVAGLFWEKSTAGWWLISQANRLGLVQCQLESHASSSGRLRASLETGEPGTSQFPTALAGWHRRTGMCAAAVPVTDSVHSFPFELWFWRSPAAEIATGAIARGRRETNGQKEENDCRGAGRRFCTLLPLRALILMIAGRRDHRGSHRTRKTRNKWTKGGKRFDKKDRVQLQIYNTCSAA